MRPQYETPEDRINEAQVASMFADAYDLKAYFEQQNFSPFDYKFITQKGKEIRAEIKCRTWTWGDFSSFYVSAMKMVHAAKIFPQVYTFIVCDKTCDIRSYRFNPKDLPRLGNAWSGRTDRGDKQDMEWVVHIPNDLFKPLRDKLSHNSKR